MSAPAVALPGRLSLVERVSAYVALTKPRIIELLLITTLPTMILAQGGLPGIWLMIATLLGGTLAAGGANAINMYVDRDIDKLMHRTRKRPLVTGVIAPRNALIFAISLEVLAFVELGTDHPGPDVGIDRSQGIDRLEHLVGLLEQVPAERGMGLAPVPRTPLAQRADEFVQ